MTVEPIAERPSSAAESKGGDFPFYNGEPTTIDGKQWWAVLGLVVLAFGVLVVGSLLTPNPFLLLAPAVLFVAIPLYGLARITPQHWRQLFRPFSGRVVLSMVGYTFLTMGLSLAIGLIVLVTYGANPNPVITILQDSNYFELSLFLLRTLPQLMGEEVLTILPFLALLTYFYSHLKWSHKRAVLVAWLLSSLWFGLLHLPTYQGNLVQSIFVVGGARMVLTFAYIRTKNLWVSTGAHILYDWILILTALALLNLEQSIQ